MQVAAKIKLFGEDLSQLDEDGRAALRAGRVGFVFQSFQLLPGMTALENVMLPLELAGETRQSQNHAPKRPFPRWSCRNGCTTIKPAVGRRTAAGGYCPGIRYQATAAVCG